MVAFNPASLKQVLDSETESKGAAFTVRSKATAKDYTFKIVKSVFKEHFYTNVYVEVEYMSFKHLGVYRNGVIQKKGALVDTPSAQAIGWVLRNVDRGAIKKVEEGVEMMHLGKCIKCGKTLTDAQSIETALGPVCRTK